MPYRPSVPCSKTALGLSTAVLLVTAAATYYEAYSGRPVPLLLGLVLLPAALVQFVYLIVQHYMHCRGMLPDDTGEPGADADTQDAFLAPDLKEFVDQLAQLKEAKQRLDIVLANVVDGILAVDFDGRFTHFNQAAEWIFGKPAALVIGRTAAEADLHPQLSSMIDECLTTGTEVSTEIRLAVTPEKVIDAHAMAYMSADTKLVCGVLTVHDVSEMRRHERSQREFVSNVSHELKTPLTAVRTTAEALLAGAKNDDQLVDRFLTNILLESDRLAVLIDDLMDVARMDAGVIDSRRSVASVRDIVDRAARVILPRIVEKDLTLTIDVPENISVVCDENQMVQAVRNLIDNSAKYNQDGGSIQVTARKSHGKTHIKVSDTGIGIPFGEMDRIFERFYRVDKARSKRLGGTGLGLSIVKSIVELHGGKISVDSKLGEGSVFTITLPNTSAVVEDGCVPSL